MEQTWHGGVPGLMRHRVSGSAPEQPVPRKISDDDTDAAVSPDRPPSIPELPSRRPAGKDVLVGADLGLIISALVLPRSSLFGLFLFIAGAGKAAGKLLFSSHLLLTSASLDDF